jgi:hypothetical protein
VESDINEKFELLGGAESRVPGFPFLAFIQGMNPRPIGSGAEQGCTGGERLAGIWLPGFRGKVPAGLEASAYGE